MEHYNIMSDSLYNTIQYHIKFMNITDTGLFCE